MNNETTDRTPVAASPLTVKEAAPPALVKTIGGTTFDIHIHFSETSKETFTDKVLRLIQNDSVTD
ncbi:transposon-encoded TnpW family protein [Anaerotruncus colihominis]|uniref:transposon-encoded TnpW family protein n=1 Tax=Anaerotruncus colihominis TaxID=169435 RepID=UPI0018AC8C7A|nr:transposon-encoded TnpW family protein [Anaerotruncus colihominis]